MGMTTAERVREVTGAHKFYRSRSLDNNTG